MSAYIPIRIIVIIFALEIAIFRDLVTNICREKEAGQNKYLSHNDFLTASFTQRLSHTIALTYSSTQHHDIRVIFLCGTNITKYCQLV